MTVGAYLTVGVSQPELMRKSPDSLEYVETTIVFGCGGGPAIANWLPKLLAYGHRLVIDSDGIKPLLQAQASRFAVRMWFDRAQLTVLTPLTLEASRFPGTSAVKVRLAARSIYTAK